MRESIWPLYYKSDTAGWNPGTWRRCASFPKRPTAQMHWKQLSKLTTDACAQACLPGWLWALDTCINNTQNSTPRCPWVWVEDMTTEIRAPRQSSFPSVCLSSPVLAPTSLLSQPLPFLPEHFSHTALWPINSFIHIHTHTHTYVYNLIIEL